MSEIAFSHPWLLVLALGLPLLPWMYRLPYLRRRGAIAFSSFDWLPPASKSSAAARWLAVALRFFVLLCLILVASGVHRSRTVSVKVAQPEAMVIVLDISSSMTAEDFAPSNRLEAAKQLLNEVTFSRSNAELGLILMANSPQLMIPVTPERDSLLQAMQKVRAAGYGEDGTAIGSAIASAVNRLRDGSWSQRRILLVTDGVNNRGSLAPLDAARIAASLGIRIDTVGIGTDSISRYWVPLAEGPPVEVTARIQIDDAALEEVSRLTGGRYRRVLNSDDLRRALESLVTDRRQIVAAASEQQDFSWSQYLAAVSILLIFAEFAFTRFICPELPS